MQRRDNTLPGEVPTGSFDMTGGESMRYEKAYRRFAVASLDISEKGKMRSPLFDPLVRISSAIERCTDMQSKGQAALTHPASPPALHSADRNNFNVTCHVPSRRAVYVP